MSRLDPPTVLLDHTFLAALTDHEEPFHAEAVAAYAELLDRYERAEVLLTATSDVLGLLSPAIRTSLFAPVQELRIAEQHRNAALDVTGPSADDPELATLLVVLRREKIRHVATFDTRLHRFDLVLIPGPAQAPAPPLDDPPPAD